MNSMNLLLIFICVALGIGVLWMLLFKKQRYKYRIRVITSKTRYIIDDMGVVWKNKERVKYVKLKKMKELVPLPPSDAIDVDSRGRKIVECYRDEVGNYSYIKDKGKVEFFNPIDTEMNVLLAEQVVKANDRNNGFLANAPLIIGLSFVLLVFLGILLFGGEALNSLSQFSDAVADPILNYQEREEAMLDKMIDLERGIQRIEATIGSDNILETPPN